MARKTVPNSSTLSTTEREAFVTGVALFDDLCREAEKIVFRGGAAADAVFLDAALRDGKPLSLYARTYLDRLVASPDLIAGFAGALGDYVGTLHHGLVPGSGRQYCGLTRTDILGNERTVNHG